LHFTEKYVICPVISKYGDDKWQQDWNFYCVFLLCPFQTGLFGAKPTGFGAPTTGLFGQQSGTGSTGFSFTQTQPQSTLGGSLFGAKTTASTGFGGFGATGTTGFSMTFISTLHLLGNRL